MITPSFSLTATERVLPSMALDFTTGVLDSRVTFTRSTTGTFINSTGVLTTAAIDAPRFDYNPTTFAPLGLLIEESRTNNLLNSESLGAATNNTPLNLTLTANAINFIDGNLVADQVLETAVTGLHAQDLSPVVFVAGTSYTFSIFFKSINGRNGSLFFPATIFTGRQANFNLTTGTVISAAAGVTAAIKDYGNGWYRCSITETCAVSGSSRPTYFAYNNSISYAGDITKGLYVCGYQLEAGAFPTSYIPTVAATVTRNPDVATMTGTNFSDWYNAVEGAFVAEHAQYAAVNGQIFAASDGTTSNRFSYRTSTFAGLVTTLGVSQAAISFGSSGLANTTYKTALAYKVNDIQAALNTTLGTAVTSATLPTVNQLSLGQITGAAFINGVIKKLNYYPQRLTNAELQAFTK